MLAPKKTKYRKMQKNPQTGKATRGTEIDFGKFAIKALEPALITSRQIEAARRVMTCIRPAIMKAEKKPIPYLPVARTPEESKPGSSSCMSGEPQNERPKSRRNSVKTRCDIPTPLSETSNHHSSPLRSRVTRIRPKLLSRAS